MRNYSRTLHKGRRLSGGRAASPRRSAGERETPASTDCCRCCTPLLPFFSIFFRGVCVDFSCLQHRGSKRLLAFATGIPARRQGEDGDGSEEGSGCSWDARAAAIGWPKPKGRDISHQERGEGRTGGRAGDGKTGLNPVFELIPCFLHPGHQASRDARECLRWSWAPAARQDGDRDGDPGTRTP